MGNALSVLRAGGVPFAMYPLGELSTLKQSLNVDLMNRTTVSPLWTVSGAGRFRGKQKDGCRLWAMDR